MHNSFILQQYVCHITILNMFRAAPCSKHVEDRNVTYILLKNKEIVNLVGNLKNSRAELVYTAMKATVYFVSL